MDPIQAAGSDLVPEERMCSATSAKSLVPSNGIVPKERMILVLIIMLGYVAEDYGDVLTVSL